MGTTLRHSHILSAWAFRRVFQRGDGKQSFMIENGTRRRSNDQDREYLLCGGCEERFGRWEKHVSGLATQPDGSSPAFSAVTLRGERQPRQETEADGTALGEETGLFAASVVWRAAVCSEPSVHLGPFREEFQSYVLGSRTDLPHARLIVNVVDPQGAHRAAEFASYPATVPWERGNPLPGTSGTSSWCPA